MISIAKRSHFFLVSMFCGTALMAPAPILSTETSAFHPFEKMVSGTTLFAICALQVGIAMNWGHAISAAARSPLRPDEVKNLPSAFSPSISNSPQRGFLFGTVIGLMYASLPMEYDPLFCCIQRIGLAGLPLFLGGHYIAYSLAKKTLEWHVDRSYPNAPIPPVNQNEHVPVAPLNNNIAIPRPFGGG